jgi:hypothetical protein
VVELLGTLDPEVPDREGCEADWIQEIERRARSAAAGGPGLSWTEARAQIQSRLSNP